ncbi:hypothetical protein ON05_006815 [Acaryochloris sp. CCMEE 5410]|nr:hypothetical protein ON05_006815 [Acaryochloris sp. CCMEE 5410]
MKYNRQKRKSVDGQFLTKITIVYLCIFSSPFIISQFAPQTQITHSPTENSRKGSEHRAISLSTQSISHRDGKDCSN